MSTKIYTIHSFLYDLTGGHFKSKYLCSKGLHNYQLIPRVEITPIVESYKNPFITITRYEKTYTMFRKCSCCGKEIDMV